MTELTVPDTDPSRDPLWQRIEAFEFDELGVEFPFAKRLARENGWMPDFAERVVLEYKRFCYLSIRAGHPVTPSDAVDQAWCLHLSDSENYWDAFCARALGQKFHRALAKGGKAENRKLAGQYQATLDFYREMSGETPPSDIWPPTHVRFRDFAAMQRINIAARIIIPRPSARQLRLVRSGAFGAGVLFMLIGLRTLATLFAVGWILLSIAIGIARIVEVRTRKDGG
jgi:hypothetical protein